MKFALLIGVHCQPMFKCCQKLVECYLASAFQGSIKVIEEYRNGTKGKDDPMECYYLFELNHDAACTEKAKQLSPGSIMLIM